MNSSRPIGTIQEKLKSAMSQKEGLVIVYRPVKREAEQTFLLFPKRILERSGHTYVEGWSAHQRTSIVLWRGRFQPSGKRRLFRVDRILAVHPRPTGRSITDHVVGKIQRRGVIPGLWGLFLDLVLILLFLLLAVKLISLLFQ